ncbi:MAG: S26 family signal peptidase [Euryarchaeota archaeon]|nr:S26 family signal peptidase [Euryarchaeota archaeon]
MNIKDIKNLFLRFWRSDKTKIALLRDVLIAFMAVLVVLLILWSYTGQWFAAPMVAIESGSMEHSNSPFGRLGTIDAGDMVLVQKVSKQSDLVTYGAAKNADDKNSFFYSNWGDVIVYKPLGRTDVSQIIHRCMCWVEVYNNNGKLTYTIEEFDIHNVTAINIPELGLNNFVPKPPYLPEPWTNSGYLTKGDHNNIIDQATDICPQPVKIEWISGKGRSEIPWVGTINLFFADLTNGHLSDSQSTVKNVHQDSLVCLAILIAFLVSIPISLDLYDYFKHKKKKKEQQ